MSGLLPFAKGSRIRIRHYNFIEWTLNKNRELLISSCLMTG